VKAYVAVTDNQWFRFLRDLAPLDEVNFWQPGGNRVFKALQVGQPFLFKLHHPENFIVGGGFFIRAWLLESSLAWKAFEEKNGAASIDEMRRRIAKYRHVPPIAIRTTRLDASSSEILFSLASETGFQFPTTSIRTLSRARPMTWAPQREEISGGTS